VLALSNVAGFSFKATLALKSLETVTSNAIVTLKREPDLMTEIPSCFADSFAPLTNGPAKFADATNWQTVGGTNYSVALGALVTAVNNLTNTATALKTAAGATAFNTSTAAVVTAIGQVQAHVSAMQTAASNAAAEIAAFTNSIACVTNSIAALSRFIDDPTNNNRTIRLWAAVKRAMIADIVAFKALNGAAAAAKTNADNLDAKLAELKVQNARLDQLNDTVTEISNWLTNISKNPFGEDGYARFVADLRDRRKKGAPKPTAGEKVDAKADQAKSAGNALDVLDEFGPPIDASELELADGVEGKHHAKDALDALISRLRYEHLRAVEEAGENSPRAVSLAQSIRVAYEQRTGMIYIRPASSYLRTSYPATSLQSDASIGWKNMLSQHMRRQTPVLGSWLEDRDNLSTILEVDKQFWQNINRVRVAGGGRGNYVIAKDDLGNWYVKQYASDPQDVIKSAKNLAMFSLGPALGASLPANNSVPGSLLNTNVTSATGKSLLEFQLDTFQSNYIAQIKEIYTNLSQTLKQDALKNKISTALATASTNQATVSALTGLTDKSVKSLIELPSIPKDPSEIEKRLNETLMSVIQVHYAFENSILSSDADAGTKDQARKTATQVLLNEIRTPLQRRREAIGTYKSGITVLNSSLNQ
jgi:hypothetical protein